MSKSQFSLLKTERFLPVFLTQFSGAFNDNVFKNALVILITYQAAGKVGIDPRILVTAAAGIFILPFFLFSATAGQLADRYDKAFLIRRIKLVEIILMVVAACAFVFESYTALLTLLFFMGVQSAFFGPLKYSILPDHLETDELIGGNGLVESSTFIAILLGTILGGLLILEPAGIVKISAIVIGVALFGWTSSLKIRPTKPAMPSLKVSYNFPVQTVKLLAQSWQQEDVFFAIVGISWFWLVGFTFLAQFPVYGKNILGANEEVVTLFLTLFSVGIGIGSLLCNRLVKGKVTAAYVPLGAFGMSVFIALLWLITPTVTAGYELIGFTDFVSQPAAWGIMACLVGIAVFGGIYIVPLYAIMQTRAAIGHRSRTIAANNIMNALFMVAGSVFTMLMLKMEMRVPDIFLLIAALNIPVAFLMMRIVRRKSKVSGSGA